MQEKWTAMVIGTNPAGSIDDHDASIYRMFAYAIREKGQVPKAIRLIHVETVVAVQILCRLALQLT
jgi:hypothetical protein